MGSGLDRVTNMSGKDEYFFLLQSSANNLNTDMRAVVYFWIV